MLSWNKKDIRALAKNIARTSFNTLAIYLYYTMTLDDVVTLAKMLHIRRDLTGPKGRIILRILQIKMDME